LKRVSSRFTCDRGNNLMAVRLVTVDDLNGRLAVSPFLRHYGFVVAGCAHGECELNVPFDEAPEWPGGIISGMTIRGAADVAMWLAIMTMRGLEERWVTSDMQTAFLRSGRAESVRCKAQVLRLGRRSAYGVAECRSENCGDLLAHRSVRDAKVTTEDRA
jgi:acyl-coenzyme A thioesterase PaaI-like protein